MNPLHEHEAWLDTLDEKLLLADGKLRSEFDHPISIPLSACADVGGLKLCAAELRKALHLNRSHLPMKYLLERFLGLAIAANQLPVTRERVMDELRLEWGIKNEYSDF
jgi:hypothetical protein